MLYASNVLEEDIKLSEEKKPSPTSLRDWTIRPFTINGISMVLAVNHETLMPAIIPGVEYLRVGVEFVLAQVVKQICSRLAINPDKATRYTDQILNGGVAYRNTSNDFLLERAFRYYVDAFSKITPEELESYEENDLLMGLAMESVTLADRERFGRQETPMINFTDQIVNQVRIPMITNKGNYFVRRWVDLNNSPTYLANFDEQAPEVQAVYDQLIDINTELIADLMTWVETYTTTDEKTRAQIKELLDQYLNDYLTQRRPMCVIDDLTSPTDFLLQWEAFAPDDADPEPILLALRYLIMYMQTTEMLSIKDSHVLMRAVQVVIANRWGESNIDLNLGYKDMIAQPDKTTQEFIDLMKKFPDSFFEFLRNLSPRERLTMIDQLAQLNKEDAAKNWKGDDL